MKTSCFAALSALVLAAPAVMYADTLVVYPNFSNTAGLTTVGNTATTTTTDGTVLRLVSATTNQNGSAYSTTPITLGAGNSFATEFQFRFTNAGGIAPADGITFVLSAASAGLGASGGGLGYSGVNNSVAIEFDTYNNGGADPNSNHVGIDVDGSLNSLITGTPDGVGTCTSLTGEPHGCMSNGDLWTALITYDGTNLNVSIADGSDLLAAVITNYSINVGSYLGTSTAYVGFTGSTGSGYENEDITNWEFSNTATLPPTTGSPSAAAPEPATWWMVGTGMAGLCSRMRRFRRA